VQGKYISYLDFNMLKLNSSSRSGFQALKGWKRLFKALKQIAKGISFIHLAKVVCLEEVFEEK